VDLTAFAADVGPSGPVTIAGMGTRGGAAAGAFRCVRAPAGIDWIQADEMTASCGAGTPVDELAAALAAVGQRVALPPGGTVGGALAAGQTGIRRLGDGAVRETLLQARYVNADGAIVKAGGPTVKNVSGFDVCRLLVGSRGTLGLLGDVIVRTHPIARSSQWFQAQPGADPIMLRRVLYHPVSILWDGTITWILLEGHPADLSEQAVLGSLTPVAGPPPLPAEHRWSLACRDLPRLPTTAPGRFIAEIGVGVVHHTSPAPARQVDQVVDDLLWRIKTNFDPTNRFNPGIAARSAQPPAGGGPADASSGVSVA
jgi:FAD/FMN-containing dehydrogenase